MKKSLLKPIAALMAMLMLFSFPLVAFADEIDVSVYTDLEQPWYYNDVVGAIQAGLFQGTSPTTFNPKGQITRSEFVTALGRLCKADFSLYQAPSFLTDVKPGQWFFEEVGWAYAAGVTEGSSPTAFSPNERITRQEMAKMLAGAVEKVYGRKLKTDGAKTFADQASIAGWAAEWVAKCSANELLKGDENGNFNPKNTASRAEAAVLFFRCYEMLKIVPPTTNPADPADPKDDIEKNYSDHFIVATYNVQSFGSEEEYNGIAKEIQELGPAIIGLQELDYLNPRHNKEDQLKILAEKAGYKYFKFTPAANENYGTGIMSKYPIKEHTVNKFKNQNGEQRSFSRSVIDMDGKIVHFYNTHLCLGDKGEQALQLSEIFKMIKQKGDKNVVITGDMNAVAEKFLTVFSVEEYVALNGGPTFLADRNTFPAGDHPTHPIDNIIVSTDWDYYLEEDTSIGILVSYSKWSDHNMAYTYLKFKG